jgi:hypothetical protein
MVQMISCSKKGLIHSLIRELRAYVPGEQPKDKKPFDIDAVMQ